jgi:hypothetical protein
MSEISALMCAGLLNLLPLKAIIEVCLFPAPATAAISSFSKDFLNCSMGVSRLHSLPEHGLGPSVDDNGVVVHYSGSLGSAAAIPDAEFLGSDRMFAKYTFKRKASIYHFDGVMSHSPSVVSESDITAKLKFCSPVVRSVKATCFKQSVGLVRTNGEVLCPLRANTPRS